MNVGFRSLDRYPLDLVEKITEILFRLFKYNALHITKVVLYNLSIKLKLIFFKNSEFCKLESLVDFLF